MFIVVKKNDVFKAVIVAIVTVFLVATSSILTYPTAARPA